MIISITTQLLIAKELASLTATKHHILSWLEWPDLYRYRAVQKKHNLASSIIINKDQTNQERAIQKLLLKERWTLIEAGFGKKEIKTRLYSLL